MSDNASDNGQPPSNNDEPRPGGLAERGWDVWRAGLGAWAAAEEEGGKVFQQLVSRGEAYEARRREEVQAVVDELGVQRAMAARQLGRAASQAEAAAGQAEGFVRGAVGRALQQINVPTRSEVDALARKIDRLYAQVERLATVIEERERRS